MAAWSRGRNKADEKWKDSVYFEHRAQMRWQIIWVRGKEGKEGSWGLWQESPEGWCGHWLKCGKLQWDTVGGRISLALHMSHWGANKTSPSMGLVVRESRERGASPGSEMKSGAIFVKQDRPGFPRDLLGAVEACGHGECRHTQERKVSKAWWRGREQRNPGLNTKWGETQIVKVCPVCSESRNGKCS